jgi:hypothetical protein
MPIFFRRARRTKGKRHWLPPGVGALRTSVFTMAGTSTMSGVATGRAETALTAAGVGAFTGAASGVASRVFTAAGVGALSGVLRGIASRVLTAAGTSTTLFSSDLRTMTSRLILRDPVDCVLAGEADAPPDGRRTQLSFKSGRPQGRALRHIFSE